MRTIFIILLLFMFTACGTAAPTPQVTVTSETTATPQPTTTVTLTPSVTATATPAVLAELDLSTIEGMKDLGDAWQFIDSASNLPVTISKSSVSIDGDWAIMGLWNVNIKTGEVVATVGSAAPRSVEEIDGFRIFTIVEGSPNEADMWKTVHLAINESVKKTADFDPKSIFAGAVVKDADGKERTIEIKDVAKDLDPSHWIDIDNAQGGIQYFEYRAQPRNHMTNFESKNGKSWFQDNVEARPIQIALDRGYFAVDFVKSDGGTMKLMAIPVVAYDGGDQITGGLALVKRGDVKDILDRFNISDRASLGLALAYGDQLSVDPARVERILLSDPELRTRMVEWNKEFFKKTPNTGTYSVYPPAISETGVFDILH